MASFWMLHIMILTIYMKQLNCAIKRGFYDLFREDCGKLSNEKTFDEGIDHWRSLFRNDSIIEMNDRVESQLINYF